MDNWKMNDKTKSKDTFIKKNAPALIRFLVQAVFFIFFPSAYSASFAGVKYIFTQLGLTKMTEVTPFVAILIALCLYTVVFGRFFCGFACAFGSMGDWLFSLHSLISKSRKKKPLAVSPKILTKLSWIKYAVLTAVIVLCVTGNFEKTAGSSPWDAFSQIRSGSFTLSGYTAGLIVLLFIMTGMFFSERLFCRVLCPMGAVFSILPVMPLFSLRRKRENCITGCSACSRKCPSDIALPDMGSYEVQGDCFQCGKCTSACPRQNIRCSGVKLKGSEFFLILLRAALLAGLFIWLGA